MDIASYIGAGTFVLGIIAYAVKLAWQLRTTELQIREDFDAQIENLQRDVLRLTNESLNRSEIIRQETGEMGSAIRQKVHDIETYTRDTFVRRDNFEQAITRLEKSFEKGIDKLEDQIERAVERFKNGT